MISTRGCAGAKRRSASFSAVSTSCSATANIHSDHLVRGGLKRRRQREIERLHGLEVDHQLELGRLQHRQVGRPRTFENAPGIDAGLPIAIADARAITAVTICKTAEEPLLR